MNSCCYYPKTGLSLLSTLSLHRWFENLTPPLLVHSSLFNYQIIDLVKHV